MTGGRGRGRWTRPFDQERTALSQCGPRVRPHPLPTRHARQKTSSRAPAFHPNTPAVFKEDGARHENDGGFGPPDCERSQRLAKLIM